MRGLPSAFGWRWSSRALGRRFRSGFRPGTLREAAWQVTIRLQFLLQWDSEAIGRQTVLDLFDAFVPRRRRCTAICAGTPAPMVREPPDRTTGTCQAQHRRHRVPQRRPRRATAGVALPVPAAPGSWPSTGR
jgi:hypothetical protein